MALSQLYSAIAGDIITAARWNNEFGNIYSNGTDVSFPVTKAVSFAGFTITLDAAGASTLVSPSNSGFVFTVGTKSGAPGENGSLGVFTASTFTDTDTATSGTAAVWTGLSVRQPTLAAGAAAVTTTLAASLYVEGAPIASTNQTIAAPYAVYAAAGLIGSAAGSDIASASSIALTENFHTVTGTADIDDISTVLPAGTSVKLRCTGAGLNFNYNGTSMITPWGVDYRTVPNEILEVISLGSGNYSLHSLNGPKERVGQVVLVESANAPAGFLPRDGAAVSRTTYSGLFAEIGTTHGVGDGSTTFNVPDGRGRVDIQIDGAANRITSASTNGANADTLGGTGGNENMPEHVHMQRSSSGGADNNWLAQQLQNADGPVVGGANGPTTDTAGTAGVTGVMNPWIAVNKYIRF